MKSFEPIAIIGIVEESVTKPRNDGTHGSALYDVPFKLSCRAPAGWGQYFTTAWDNPSGYTNMHRKGICTVSGDMVWLNGTTLEEVAQYHKATLLLALQAANEAYAAFEKAEQAARIKAEREHAAHEAHVREVAKKITF